MAGQQVAARIRGAFRRIGRAIVVETEIDVGLDEETEKQSAVGAVPTLFMFAQPWFDWTKQAAALHDRHQMARPWTNRKSLIGKRSRSSRPGLATPNELQASKSHIGRDWPQHNRQAYERLFFVRLKPSVTRA